VSAEFLWSRPWTCSHVSGIPSRRYPAQGLTAPGLPGTTRCPVLPGIASPTTRTTTHSSRVRNVTDRAPGTCLSRTCRRLLCRCGGHGGTAAVVARTPFQLIPYPGRKQNFHSTRIADYTDSIEIIIRDVILSDRVELKGMDSARTRATLVVIRNQIDRAFGSCPSWLRPSRKL